MEALALLKFWKWNSAKVSAGTTLTESAVPNDDDDSFFELELTLPPYNTKLSDPCSSSPPPPKKPTLKPQPQSPISILRSAAPPKLRVFMFGKLKRRRPSSPKTQQQQQQDMDTESTAASVSPRRSTSKLFTVRFKIQDGSFVPELARTDSSPKLMHRRSFEDCCESSKRFSKEAVQKYLNRIKAPYVKSSWRHQGDKEGNVLKVKCRQLGKSKSASSTIGAPSPSPSTAGLRNDYCYDGIEGAILHCKRSLTSSKGSPSLSRCSSDPSHEKSLKVSE